MRSSPQPEPIGGRTASFRRASKFPTREKSEEEKTMTTVTLTVAEIRQPPVGKDRGYVIGVDGCKYGLFREKMSMLAVGGTYEVEVSDGQYANVKSVKQLAADQQQQGQSVPTKTNGH